MPTCHDGKQGIYNIHKSWCVTEGSKDTGKTTFFSPTFFTGNIFYAPPPIPVGQRLELIEYKLEELAHKIRQIENYLRDEMEEAQESKSGLENLEENSRSNFGF